MVNIVGKLTASKKIFMLYVISLFVLWFSVRISGGYITKLSEQIYINHQIELVTTCDSLLFSEKIGTYLFGTQFLLLIVLILITRPSTHDASIDKSVPTETIVITLFSLNFSVVILFFLGLNFIYNPAKAALLLILLFVAIAASFIAYNVMNDSDESDSFVKGKFARSVLNRWKSFGFPYFRITFILYIIMIYGYVESVRQITTGWLVQPISKIIFFLISAVCIVYSLLGVVKNINRKDELQRQMFYEQTFLVYVIMIGLLMAFIAFALFFNYTFNGRDIDIMVVLIMILLISGFIVRARYQ